MKIKWKPREHKNENDCWCDAIALATNISYDKIWKLFKPFTLTKGELNQKLRTQFIDGFLMNKGFTTWEIHPITISEAVKRYNTHDNKVVLFMEGHVVCVHKNTIYDTIDIEERSEYLKSEVVAIAMKEKRID